MYVLVDPVCKQINCQGVHGTHQEGITKLSLEETNFAFIKECHVKLCISMFVLVCTLS